MKTKFEILQIGSCNLLKSFALIIILAFMMLVITNAQSGQPNFAGNWVFNASKSDIGAPLTGPAARGAGGREGGVAGAGFVATQDANLLTITTTIKDQDGKPITKESKYTLDFKPSVNTTIGRNGNTGTSTSYAKWNPDGKTLRITTTTVGNGSTKVIEEWSLINANTLSRTSTNIASGGAERKTIAVFNRK